MVLLLILLLILAFFSSSETSLFSLSAFTIRSYQMDPDPKKKMIASLLLKPTDLLVTIMMVNILSNILIQNRVSDLFGSYNSWLLNVLVPLFLTLFLGEIIPKSIAIVHNKTIAYRVAPIISFIATILGPLRVFFTYITKYISRFMFFFLKKDTTISTEELQHIVDTSAKKGILNLDETELASGYLDLQDSTVKEKMRPKEEIIFYDINTPLIRLSQLFSTHNFSQIPVCEKTIDQIVGLISLKSFFFNQDQIKTHEDLRLLLKKPLFVPETTNGWDFLLQLKDKLEEEAFVVDEYGSIIGMISQEDLFSTVIGEIENVAETKHLYIRPSHDVIIAEGKMEISDFEDLFKCKLSESSSITLGGWLMEKLEKIPQPSDKYITEEFLFYILEADPTKVKRIYIRKLKNE